MDQKWKATTAQHEFESNSRKLSDEINEYLYFADKASPGGMTRAAATVLLITELMDGDPDKARLKVKTLKQRFPKPYGWR